MGANKIYKNAVSPHECREKALERFEITLNDRFLFVCVTTECHG